jgi:hypothetical protein
MPDENKTSLTNTSVRESEESGSSRKGPGNDHLNDPEKFDESGIPWKNRAGEYKSKYESVAAQADQVKELVGLVPKLKEMLESGSLSPKQEQKVQETLDDAEAQLQWIKSNPELRGYVELVKREAGESSKSTHKAVIGEIIDDMIDGWAESEEMDAKELRAELNKVLRAEHMEMSPIKRTRAAYKEFKKVLAAKKDAEEAKVKKETEDKQFREGPGRVPRATTIEEAKKSGDNQSRMKLIGLT